MPEDNIIDLERSLDLLEDPIIEKPLLKNQYYKVFIKALENDTCISLTVLNRILALCAVELQNDTRSPYFAMKIITLVLKKIKAEDYGTLSSLSLSLLGVLNIIKTTALLNKMENLQTMCFDILLLYPNEILIEVVANSTEITEILNLYCHVQIPLEVRLLPCPIIQKLLKILPPEKKKSFVKENLNVWFTKFIPTIFAGNSIDNDELNLLPLDTLELLTDELVSIDYDDDPHWQHLFECIYNPQKYPSMMKLMLVNDWKNWHRLWIVCIRLLKNQITRITSPVGSPINSMLPVVETAFKMDVTNRCRAFQCWNVLIDNFHTETNENYIVKRLKLLIIPLKSNNAKVEQTALAKLKTWWHLIYRFQTRLDRFVDTVIISFLNYCFGKQKPGFVPGLLTTETKKLSVESFIELAGHLCCSGCVNVPKLKGRIVTKKMLVDFWTEWVHSLKTAIMVYNENSIGITMNQITCLWKSFVAIVAELPDNNIRKDLFNELLGILEDYLKDQKFIEIAMHLSVSLFDDKKIAALLKPRDTQGPTYKIMKLLLDPSLNTFYRKNDTKNLSRILKPLASYILDKATDGSTKLMSFLLELDIKTYNISFLLTSLAECIYEFKYEDVNKFYNLVVWPLKPDIFFIDVEYCSQVWSKLIDYIYPNLNNNLKDDLATALWSTTVDLNTYLKLHACLVILNHELSNVSVVGYAKMVELLMLILDNLKDESLNDAVNILINTVASLLQKVKDENDEILVDDTMIIAEKVLMFLIPVLEKDFEIGEDKRKALADLLENIKPILQRKPQYRKVVIALVNFSTLLKKIPELQKIVNEILKLYASHLTIEDFLLHKTIQDAINSTESSNSTIVKPVSKIVNNDKFAEPDLKIFAKKGKKKEKETSIVNTVVENGEEFVVVKSNWKFNPRKLTENQKEKFQRKREDIPALYQDLSQSQDEFKLTSWKTDSQDSSSSKSTSASKSTDSGNVSEILKKMPSSDVVPKIIENILSNKTGTNVNKEKKSSMDLTKVKHTNPKDPKSPRMALKDRVFRNVRNLIEKSSGQKDGKALSESLNQLEDISKTPTSTSNNNSNNSTNSAPPKINTERPSRVKRKPKKFDNVTVFNLKRERRSASQTDSHSDSLSPTMINEIDKEQTPEREINDNIIQKDRDKIETQPPNSSQDLNIIQTVAIIENIPPETVPSLQSDKRVISKPLKPIVTVSAESKVDDTQNNEMEVDDKRKELLPIETSKVGALKDKHELESDVIVLSDNDNKDVIVLSDSKNTIESPKINHVVRNKDVPQTINENISIMENDKTLSTIDKTSEDLTVSIDITSEKTPKPMKKQDLTEQRSARRSSVKKSRIEKELAIDTVEGHPFLKIQTEKRITRKNLNNLNTIPNTTRRKTLTEKLNKSKIDAKTTPKHPKKDKDKNNSNNVCFTVKDSQDNCSEISDDLPLSEDVIESSQDSSFTAISVKSAKKTLKKLSVVVHKVPLEPLVDSFATQDSLSTDKNFVATIKTLDSENKDDSILPQNKTAVTDKTDLELTENMDTQPIDDAEIDVKDDSDDVILINDDDDDPVIVNSSETQEIAEADTQPMNPVVLMEICTINGKTDSVKVNSVIQVSDIETNNTTDANTEDKITTTINELSVIVSPTTGEDNTASSPLKDEAQRKKDFLDNTLEISPIKTMSPVRDKKSPSPETSSDYVVIKLTSPVQSNGEPFEKCNSPEIFTEEKVSPDKRDLSPPREENANNNNSSPSSSLSLKKNRPQVRPGGRAAQMLGLCVPDRLQTIINTERTEIEEPKKNSPSSTPARRNLRILYNSVGETSETSDENEESENFLKFKRCLPTSECSPSGPILKRKLAEITDDATISPVSKRKRVSFHDPPVSTTVSVQKYIEPNGIRSPQNSALKRQERQNLRSQVILKSPKRLDNVFKLDTALTKTVESFIESEETSSQVTQSMSLDETPAVEIIRNSDLNDVDPICPDLVGCKDPIRNIAAQLSSATMKRMFLQELEGRIETVGDLAKKTELEVNRLCIKAPKIKVAKKVLEEYAFKKIVDVDPIVNTTDLLEERTSPEMVTIEKMDAEMQTFSAELKNAEIQTIEAHVVDGCVQTDIMSIVHIGSQTDESGVKSTKDLVTLCIAERPDFVEKLGQHLEDSSKQKIAESLPFDTLTEVFMKNVTNSNTNTLISRILSKQSQPDSSSEQLRSQDLALLQDYLSERFDNRDLIMFCSQLLAKIHDKS